MSSSFQLLKQSINIFLENPKLFISILAVPALFSFVAALLLPSEETAVVDLYEWGIYLVVALMSMITGLLSAIAMVHAVNDRSLTMKLSYSLATANFWRFLWYNIALSFIVFLGFILLVIPGIIMSVWFTFGAFVLLLEGTGTVESLKRSRALVKGRWWGVAGKIFMLIIFGILFSLATTLMFVALAAILGESVIYPLSSISGYLMNPFAIGYMYLLYREVSASSVAASTAPSYQ